MATYKSEQGYIKEIIPWPGKKVVLIELTNQPGGKDRFTLHCSNAYYEIIHSSALVALANHLPVHIHSHSADNRSIVYMRVYPS